MGTTKLLILFLFSSTSLIAPQSSDVFIGAYSVKDNGQMKEYIKIEKHGNEFTVSEKLNGRWLSPKVVVPVTKSQMGKLLGKPINIQLLGLGNDNAALIKVPKGWHLDNFVCNTGYWLATVLGPIELYKN
ncbi:hypothetical protein [Mucilaginibacter sp.]|jgi:hypothetical protein|uniref:hypothetical protein n=1 Tax=Mucilaginibacter sp. TaxID=1882438 RepID=UPI002C697F81|nr:hypothetical protein [Mucilaginibacter sp.]HTI60525.1 hypothetical protein [Mucilaginibacter sp.]